MASLLAEIPAARVQPYVRVAKGDTKRALAYYYWNVELCRAFYPALNALEIGLRNAVDRAVQRFIGDHDTLKGRTQHAEIRSWLTVTPSLIVHPAARATLARSLDEVLPTDSRGNIIAGHGKNHGDLVAKLPFGFWTSLLADEYGPSGVPTPALAWWGATQNIAFPSASGTTMPVINRQFTAIRHFRNRVFHHEPIWPKHAHQQTPDDWYTTVLGALRWIGGSQAQLPPALHGRPKELELPGAIDAMEARLVDTVDTLLKRAAEKAEAKAERKQGQTATKSAADAPGTART